MKFLKTITIATVLMFSFGKANAQKIAHIDYDSLTSMMPQTDSVKKVMTDFVDQLKKTLDKMQNDLKSLYDDYQLNKDKWTPLILGVKEKELQDSQQRIQDFQTSAQQAIQKRNEELVKPINKAAKDAIKAVAIAKGYKLVIDSGLENVLYSEASDDIMPLVKAQLKIKTPGPAPK